MGLSLMAPAPDADQQLKYLNSMGAFASITPGQWVGESNLQGLGLDDPNQGIQQFQQGANIASNLFKDVYNTIQANKKNKNKGQPQANPNRGGAAPAHLTSGGSGGGLPSWVIWGGGILVVGLLLYVLMKKKKGGRDRDRNDEPRFEKGD